MTSVPPSALNSSIHCPHRRQCDHLEHKCATTCPTHLKILADITLCLLTKLQSHWPSLSVSFPEHPTLFHDSGNLCMLFLPPRTLSVHNYCLVENLLLLQASFEGTSWFLHLVISSLFLCPSMLLCSFTVWIQIWSICILH